VYISDVEFGVIIYGTVSMPQPYIEPVSFLLGGNSAEVALLAGVIVEHIDVIKKWTSPRYSGYSYVFVKAYGGRFAKDSWQAAVC